MENVSPLLMPAAHALVQAERDLGKAVGNLSDEQLWAKPNGAPSVGFHLLHIAGSIDRLLSYSRGEQLSDAQFAALAAESEDSPADNALSLARRAAEKIDMAIEAIKAVPEDVLFEARTVGRKELPSTVFGLLFHIAEHTQRHVGQVVTTARIVGGAQSK